MSNEDTRPRRRLRLLVISDSGAPAATAVRQAVEDAASAAAEGEPDLWDCGGAAAGDPRTRAELRAAVERSQAIVLLAPVRNRSCSKAITTLLDDLDARAVRRKPVGLVSIGERTDLYAVDHLRVVMASMQAVVIPQALLVAREDLLQAPDGTAGVGGDLFERLQGFVDELVWFVTRLCGDSTGEATGGGASSGVLRGRAAAQPLTGAGRGRLSSAVDYIHRNFTDSGLTLDLAARTAHMSRYHFSRMFKKHTGRRFIDYVTDLRLDRARSLLLHTDLTIGEVCRNSGYNDMSHFQRTFKAACGMSLSHYRTARTGEPSAAVRTPEGAK